MRAHSEHLRPEASPAATAPIVFLTENGFSIVRASEIEQVSPPAAGCFHFLVRSPQDVERDVTVEVAANVLDEIGTYMRTRILLSNSFSISCAERHLADYLWQSDDFPPANKLVVEHLDPEEIILARRWEESDEWG